MQALERASPDLPLTEKHIRRRECNYIRHGTQSLIAGLSLAKGEVYASVDDTRKEIDFVSFIEYMIQDQSDKEKFVFILDQLNTHKSESLVRLTARLNGDTQKLGIKGKSGILKNMATRMKYLEGDVTEVENQVNRIRFVFTPKHCSWLNVIEGWFSALQSRVLKWGSFSSLEELAQRIIDYVNYYNTHWAKTINWTKVSKNDVDILVSKVKRMVMTITG